MDTRQPVKTIMSPQPVTVEFSRDVFSTQAIFRKFHFRHLPVVHRGEVVGLLSKTDVDRLSFSYAMTDDDFDDGVELLKVSQLMFPHPYTVREDESILKAASILTKVESHALLVLSEDGKNMVGIVSTTDIIRYLLPSTEE